MSMTENERDMRGYVKVDDVMNLINTSNRGNCDYFIVDQIEELCMSEKIIDEQEIRNKAIDEFAERLQTRIKTEIDDCADELEWIDEIAEQMKKSS